MQKACFEEDTQVKKPMIVMILAAFCAAAFGFCAASSNRDEDKAAITSVLASQQSAWNEGKVDVFLEGYWHSDELTFSGSSGVARGFNAVRERYQKNYPDRQAMGKLDFSELEIRILDQGANAALVLGRWHLSREKGDVGGVFSLVFQRFPEGWKIIHDHTSVVPSSPATH